MLIVFDDVGFSDFGCFGSEIETPNIDGLAAGGLRYTNFHTTALCSPTRASLLTGRNHHSVGMGVVSNWDTGFPAGPGPHRPQRGHAGRDASARGYHTFAVGKWHLMPTDETSAAGPFDHWPLPARLRPLLRVPRRRHRPLVPRAGATTTTASTRRATRATT